MAGLLNLLYVFLYAPILYVVFVSFSEDIVWPFPLSLTSQAYADLFSNSLYADALANSLILGVGSGIISTAIATAGVIGILRYPSKRRTLIIVIFLSPLFVAELLIGISSLAFNSRILGLPGNMFWQLPPMR